MDSGAHLAAMVDKLAIEITYQLSNCPGTRSLCLKTTRNAGLLRRVPEYDCVIDFLMVFRGCLIILLFHSVPAHIKGTTNISKGAFKA